MEFWWRTAPVSKTMCIPGYHKLDTHPRLSEPLKVVRLSIFRKYALRPEAAI